MPPRSLIAPRLRWSPAACALAGLVLAGCGQKDGAVQVLVHFEGLVPGCLRVTATSNGKADAVEVRRAQLSQPNRAVIAVAKDAAWGSTVELTLDVFERDCTGTTLTQQVDSLALQKGRVVTWETTVSIPDADGDGYAPVSAGGTDCADNDAARHPGATEDCTRAVDLDCNGAAGCQDSACSGQSCGGPATCSTGSTCQAGVCQPAAVTCTQPPGECFTSPGTCQPSDGGCSYPVNGTAKCTLPDGGADGGCRADGTCAYGEVNCADGIDNDNNGLTDCADPACWLQACDDHNACTGPDVCTSGSDAGCVGAAMRCTAAPGVCFTDAGVCVAQNDAGTCVYPGAPAAVLCSTGDLCTSGDHCGGDGGCVKGAPAVTCNSPPPDQGCYQAGACQPASGTCLYAPKPAASPCPDPTACFAGGTCDNDGGCSGNQYTCIPRECQTGAQCLGNGTCSFTLAGNGTSCDGGTCTGGACVPFPDGGPGTFTYAPDNFDPTQYVPFTGPVIINCAATLNTDVGFVGACTPSPAASTSTITMLGGAGQAALLPIKGLAITAAGSLTVTGSLPLILAVYGDATLDGPIYANSQFLPDAGTKDGPGARSFLDCGAQAGGDGGVGQRGGGAGGAGFATAGANGGRGDTNNTNITGGSAGTAASGGDAPLLGGCPGGWGGITGGTQSTAPGGLGGGAVQLSVAGRLRMTSVISSSGQGGRANTSGNGDLGGGGGGSGGVIDLQAAYLEATATCSLTANGGAGAGGEDSNNRGGNGADGPTASQTPAAGGARGNNNAGAGGDGAARGSAPTVGGNGSSRAGGGGGGAVGRIFAKNYNDAGCPWAPAVESPQAARTNCP